MHILKRPWFIPALVLFFISLIAAENFLLPASPITEIKEGNDFIISRGKTSRHETYILIAKTGHRYNVPRPPYNYLSIGDSFIIHRSILFKKPLKIEWCEPGGCYIMSIGTMNGNYFSMIILGVLGLWALLNLIGIVKPSGERKGYWNSIALGASGMLLVLYLWY